MAPSREQHAFVLSKRGRRREPELVRGSSGRELEMAVCSRTQNPLREAPGGRHRRADGTEPAVGMWVADEDAPRCQRPACRDSPAFGLFWKRRRCDRCGAVVCSSCVAPEPLYLDQWVREGQRNPGTLRGASADSSGWFAPRQVCIDCFRSSATAGSGALQHHQLEQLGRELPTTGSVALVSLGTGVAGGWSSFARSPPDARTRLAYRRLACAMLLHERVARRSHWPDGVELGLVKFIADQPCVRAQGTALDAALAQQFKDKARDYNSTSRRISGLRWKPLNRKCAGVASLFGAGAAAGCAGAVPTIAAGTILKVGSCGFAAGVIPGTAFCLTCTHPEGGRLASVLQSRERVPHCRGRIDRRMSRSCGSWRVCVRHGGGRLRWARHLHGSPWHQQCCRGERRHVCRDHNNRRGGEGGDQRTDPFGHRTDHGLRGCAVWAGVAVWQGASVLRQRLHWRRC